MFNKGIHKRIKIVLLIVLFIFAIIIAKVFYIEVIDYKKLNSLASGLWSRNLPIEADRGNIYTVDGEAIASNLTTTSLVFIPNQIKNKDLVAEKISEILDVPKSKIEEHLYKKSMMERVHPEGRRLSYNVADKIENLHFDGVYLLKESKRYYPHNEMLSHVLGYVGIDNQGLSGLELEYDDILTGEYGSIQYFSDAKGNNLERNSVYVEPEDGLDIYLTVDYGIQSSIERELDNVVLRYNPDGAWAIAMDPNTGEILGMSSRPNFNPNSYKDYDILLRPVLDIIRENKNQSLTSIRLKLFLRSGLKEIIDLFVNETKITPGIILDFGTFKTRDTVICGNRCEVDFENGYLVSKKIPMEMDTIFDLASTSKVFTAVAVLKLEEVGLIDVFDPVKKYVPEFRKLGDTTIYDLLKDDSVNGHTKIEIINDFDKVFSLDLTKKTLNTSIDMDKYIKDKIEERRIAKMNKNYELSDSIRDELLDKGIILTDTREGTTYRISK